MSNSGVIASRVTSWEMQESFASFSGDRNPMHMDECAARRSQAGRPVVHGIHTLLWALESLAGSGNLISPPSRIRVKFHKWVYPDDEVTLTLPLKEPVDPRQLLVAVQGIPVLTAELFYEANEPGVNKSGADRPVDGPFSLPPSPASPLTSARERSLSDLQDCAGNAFTPLAAGARVLFPRLTVRLSAQIVAEVAACSYIVGMEAPGLYSMFSKLDLTLRPAAQPEPPGSGLHYRVSYLDERFGKARLVVTGRGVAGTLEVFVRTPPVQQPSMTVIAPHVSPSEFAGMRALIVGGSRGLGELTAKMIAAGGGRPTITYAVGKAEATEVAGQIRQWGGEIEVLQYDVLRPPESQLEGWKAGITHLFYFATNPVSRSKSGLVSSPALNDFIAFYLQGFHDLCLQLTQPGKPYTIAATKLIVYYPSSVYIGERPAGMTGYAMIKAAGEQMCRDMTQYLPDIHILVTRLPRLPTDQTLTIMPERTTDPIPVILPIIRRMQSLAVETDSILSFESPA